MTTLTLSGCRVQMRPHIEAGTARLDSDTQRLCGCCDGSVYVVEVVVPNPHPMARPVPPPATIDLRPGPTTVALLEAPR